MFLETLLYQHCIACSFYPAEMHFATIFGELHCCSAAVSWQWADSGLQWADRCNRLIVPIYGLRHETTQNSGYLEHDKIFKLLAFTKVFSAGTTQFPVLCTVSSIHSVILQNYFGIKWAPGCFGQQTYFGHTFNSNFHLIPKNSELCNLSFETSINSKQHPQRLSLSNTLAHPHHCTALWATSTALHCTISTSMGVGPAWGCGARAGAAATCLTLCSGNATCSVPRSPDDITSTLDWMDTPDHHAFGGADGGFDVLIYPAPTSAVLSQQSALLVHSVHLDQAAITLTLQDTCEPASRLTQHYTIRYLLPAGPVCWNRRRRPGSRNCRVGSFAVLARSLSPPPHHQLLQFSQPAQTSHTTTLHYTLHISHHPPYTQQSV